MRTRYRRVITPQHDIALAELILDKDDNIMGIARVNLRAKTPELLDYLMDKIDDAWAHDPIDIRPIKIARNGFTNLVTEEMME